MYYAISGIGYGMGSTPADAIETYFAYGRAARPSWMGKREWDKRLTDPDNAPSVFLAPPGATGFRLSGGTTVCWTNDRGERWLVSEEDRVRVDI